MPDNAQSDRCGQGPALPIRLEVRPERWEVPVGLQTGRRRAADRTTSRDAEPPLWGMGAAADCRTGLLATAANHPASIAHVLALTEYRSAWSMASETFLRLRLASTIPTSVVPANRA
jgi:hypothetical protein